MPQTLQFQLFKHVYLLVLVFYGSKLKILSFWLMVKFYICIWHIIKSKVRIYQWKQSLVTALHLSFIQGAFLQDKRLTQYETEVWSDDV